jgi:hypothetical protein
MPDLYDLRKVEELILDRTKIPNAKSLLKKVPEPQKLNAVNENVAATMGSPIVAFPEQDHLAHIQVHLSYISNPLLGGSRIIAPVVIPPMLNHLKDHIALWYVSETVRIASEAVGQDISALMDPKNPDVDQAFDRMLAAADAHVEAEAARTLGAVPQVIQQAIQLMQQYQPQQPDPTQLAIQAQAAETQRKAMADQAKVQTDQQKIAANTQSKQLEIQAREQMNREDNQTAMLIAASELEAGHRTNLKNGTGIAKG